MIFAASTILLLIITINLVNTYYVSKPDNDLLHECIKFKDRYGKLSVFNETLYNENCSEVMQDNGLT